MNVFPKSQAQTNLKALELDIHKMRPTREGLPDFYWPLSYFERDAFVRQLVESCTEILREEENEDEARPYKLVAKNFIAEATTFFQGDSLSCRFRDAGYDPKPPENWKYWPCLFAGKAPPAPAFLESLRAGPAKPSAVKKLFNPGLLKKALKQIRFRKEGLSIDGLKVGPLNKDILKNNIITLQRGAFIGRHAACTGEDVYFVRSERWFHEVSEQEEKRAQEAANPVIEARLLKAVESAYQKQGTVLPPYSRQYLQDLLSRGAALARVHYERLIKNPGALPARLWTGSFGNTWDALLGLAVVANGGQVTAHDHGAGAGHTNMIQMGLVEFWGCTHYMAFTPGQAEELRKLAARSFSLDRKLPEICGLEKSEKGNDNEGLTVLPQFEGEGKPVKTIILLATIYDGDRDRIGPGAPDNFLIDWQARLISHLQDWGYKVIIKLHPESPPPPPYFEKEFGVEVTMDYFEDIFERGDLFLFDYLYTTAFSVALKTNVPMVFIDFYGDALTDKAESLLGKRAGLVQGGYEQNRAQIDWNALKRAIEQAPVKSSNHEFAKYYYL